MQGIVCMRVLESGGIDRIWEFLVVFLVPCVESNCLRIVVNLIMIVPRISILNLKGMYQYEQFNAVI